MHHHIEPVTNKMTLNCTLCACFVLPASENLLGQLIKEKDVEDFPIWLKMLVYSIVGLSLSYAVVSILLGMLTPN